MPIFKYRARTKDGTLITGNYDTVDASNVVKYLRNVGHSVVSVEAKSELTDFIGILLQKVKGIKHQEVIFFTRQLGVLLGAGIPLDTALDSLTEQVKNPQFREIIKEVLADIESGLDFSDALKKHPQVFTQIYTSMIKVAETAGILDKILERLTHLGLRDLEIRTRLRSALTYPIVLVSLAICVVSYLLAAVVPRFVILFANYGFKLPMATIILLKISLIARYFWFVIIVAIVGGGIALRNYLKHPEARFKVDSFILKIPVLGDFYLKVNLANFSRTLAALIQSGVPILGALSVSRKTLKSSVLNRVVEEAYEAIKEGKTITEPFAASGVFPSMVVQMISAGEKTGELDKMLSEVANFYDQEIEYAIRNMSSMLEPILLAIMGLIVAFIALAILSPIFNLIKVFR